MAGIGRRLLGAAPVRHCMDTAVAVAVALVWRPVAWDVKLTRGPGPRRVWPGGYSRRAHHWVKD